MFVALAFICDDYFISSLDKICEVSENIWCFLGVRNYLFSNVLLLSNEAFKSPK